MKFEFILTLTDICRRLLVLYIASTVLVHSQMHRFLLLTSMLIIIQQSTEIHFTRID